MVSTHQISRGSEDSLMQTDDEQTKEVITILKEIRANLTENERAQLDDEIKQLGVNLEATKQIIRIFHLCWNKQGLSETIMKEIFNEDENEEPEVDKQIPMEVKGLDDTKLRMFAKALQEGHEEVQRIRAMVVGMFSVGKTSLVNNLIDDLKNKRPPSVYEQYPPSTEGIDVHLCKIENEKWKKLALTQKRNMKHALENSMAYKQYDDVDSGMPVVEQEPIQEEEMEVGEQTEENTHVKVPEQPPVFVPVDLEKLKKKLDEPDEIEHTEEKPQTFYTKAHEEIRKESDYPGNPPLVSVWDFAGQNLYYSTHHFFLNKRSIYLLLMDMTKQLSDLVEESESLAGLVHEKFTCLDAFKFWLNSIHMYSSIHDQEHEDKPTVILIGTHKDEMSGTDEEKEEYMNAFFNDALKPFIDSNILKHVHDRKFLVNNLDAKDPVFDEIRNEVKKVAEVQPYWNEKHPLKWIQLEKTFEQMRGDGKEMVKLREVEAANRENPRPLENAQLLLFLEVQHMYGNILYFKTEELKEHVILSPQWIIEAFKCFINHKEKHVPPKLLKQWQSYKESAILEPELLQAILAHSAPQIKANAAVVVEYMEYLKIMAKPIHLEDYEEEERVQQDDNSCVDPNYRGPICAPLNSDGEICCDDHKMGDEHTMQTDEHLKCWYSDVLKHREERETTCEGIELGLRQVDMEQIRQDHFDTREDFIFHVLLKWRQQKNETLKKLKQVFVAVMKNSPEVTFEIFSALKELTKDRDASTRRKYVRPRRKYVKPRRKYETQVCKTETQVCKTETQVCKTETQGSKTETQVCKTETQVSKTETLICKTETQVSKTETQVSKTETQVSKTETQVCKTETQGSKTETQVCKTETQVCKTETQVCKTETQGSKTEKQVCKTETQGSKTETQITETQVCKTETQVCKTETQVRDA
ncbi:SGS4-like protein, partial [Mya arenaria]